jgi:hypothetical protein
MHALAGALVILFEPRIELPVVIGGDVGQSQRHIERLLAGGKGQVSLL